MRATVLALALLCGGAAFAQSTTTQSSSVSSREATHLNNLATLLDLTDAQKAQVQSILEQEHAQIKAAFEQAKASGTKPDWQQIEALHQQIEQDTLTKLTPVLSATQLKKFQVLSEMHHFGHRGPPPASSSASTPAQN